MKLFNDYSKFASKAKYRLILLILKSTHFEITEVELVHCNIVNNDY